MINGLHGFGAVRSINLFTLSLRVSVIFSFCLFISGCSFLGVTIIKKDSTQSELEMYVGSNYGSYFLTNENGSIGGFMPYTEPASEEIFLDILKKSYQAGAILYPEFIPEGFTYKSGRIEFFLNSDTIRNSVVTQEGDIVQDGTTQSYKMLKTRNFETDVAAYSLTFSNEEGERIEMEYDFRDISDSDAEYVDRRVLAIENKYFYFSHIDNRTAEGGGITVSGRELVQDISFIPMENQWDGSNTEDIYKYAGFSVNSMALSEEIIVQMAESCVPLLL